MLNFGWCRRLFHSPITRPSALRHTRLSAWLMVTQEHESLLNETDRSQGRVALRNNVAAASALADAVRSTLGPKGLDKMLVSGEGGVTVTNDGVTVLETAKVEHPTAKMLIAQSSAQDREAGDGTTRTGILTAELLQNLYESDEYREKVGEDCFEVTQNPAYRWDKIAEGFTKAMEII